MIVRNDCVKEDTIMIELDGYCSSISDITYQNPVIDCDSILVCIGPYFVNLENLISEVNTFIQDSNNSNQQNFHLLYSQYQSLYNFFLKCCIEMTNRLDKIQMRLDKMVIVREIISKPLSIPYPKSDKPKFISPVPIPKIIKDETYIIDQTIRNGYIESFSINNGYYTEISNYVFWLKDGVRRKLLSKDIPFRIGTPEANGLIQVLIRIFNSYNLELDISELKYQRINN